MPGAVSFKDLRVWNVSVELVVLVYKATATFPRAEIYGLSSQMRRAAISLPANVAEGNSRMSTAAYLNHVHVALGSLGELRTLTEIASRLEFLPQPDRARLNHELDEVGRLLFGLRTSLKQRLESRP